MDNIQNKVKELFEQGKVAGYLGYKLVEGHPLPQGSGNVRGPRIIHAHGEKRAKNPAAIHGKRGNQIEQHQEDIDAHENLEKRNAGYRDGLWQGEALGQEQPEKEDAGDSHVDRWPRNSDEELLARIFWHAL